MNNFWEILKEIDGGHILDVACGSGQFIWILVKNLKSYETITGIDVDEKSLDDARKDFTRDHIKFVSGSACKIPFTDESFDTVTISKGLHHLANVNQGLQEMKRVLKQGGRMILFEMFRDHNLTDPQKTHMLYHHTRADVDKLLGINHNYTFLKDEILELVGRLNLMNVKMRDYIEENPDPESPVLQKEYERKMNGWLSELEGHEKRNEISLKIEEVKSRLKKYGVSRPPNLLIVGHK